ncbi:MAG: hypothetical protein ACJ8J0_21950 [Longimicrobiaceae bacterium]
MTSIPGRRRQRFYERKTVVELLAVVPPVAMGAVTAAINLRDPGKRPFGWLLAAAIGWLVIASIVKVLHAQAQDREQRRREEYDGLLGALHVLYAAVSARAGIDRQDGRLRVTIHRVVPPSGKGRAAEELEQLLPYVGGRGNDPGRRFSIRSGVIGKAVREKGVFAASRQNDNYEQFLAELVRDWAYTEADARQLSPDRRAWMAVPIFSPKAEVVGVTYLDSNQTGFFTPELQQLIIDACRGIASYVTEVYA